MRKMKLNFENSRGVERCIAEVVTLEEAYKEIKKFLDDHNFKSYYTRRWNPQPWHTVFDVGSHTEFFHLYDEEMMQNEQGNIS